MKTSTLFLYYDGLCPLCAREMAHYRQHVHDDSVRFIDITDPSFSAADHGLDAEAIHRVMHVKVGDAIHTGLDAFLAIWDAVPGYRWASRLARVPALYALLDVGYQLFARVRPFLPRLQRAECQVCGTGIAHQGLQAECGMPNS